MFERQKPKSQDKAHLNGITNCVPPAQLLLKFKRSEDVLKLYQDSHLDEARFDTLCRSLLHNVLKYSQQLPDTVNSYFSNPGGVFEHAISRTTAASELFHSIVLPQTTSRLSEEQQLWWYALFSAGLLKGIGKLVLDYEVKLYNTHGHFIKTWSPLLEPMYQTTNGYQFDTINLNRSDTFRCQLNILLAQSIMPAQGFAWISQNLDVLETWLALLHEDIPSSGTLGLILDRADAIAIQDDLINPKSTAMPHTHPKGRPASFIDIPDMDLLTKEQLVGIEFIKWFLAALEGAKLTFNQHPLLNVPGGTFIGPDTFKLFVREHPQFKNWLAVKTGVQALNIHEPLQEDSNEQGMTIKSTIALPHKLHAQLSENSKPTMTNAIDARNPGERKQLAENGKWQAPETKHAPSLKQNPFYGE